MRQLRKRLSLYVVVPVLIIAMVGGVNCGNGTSPQVAEEMVQNEETTTSNPMDPAIPVLQSDLEITQLELSDYGSAYDPRLWTGATFSILVQVTNQGQAASGDYTLIIFEIFDFSTLVDKGLDSGWCYYGHFEWLIDSYTMGSLAPGETHTFKKEEALFDIPTWHTIYAELTPIGWQESDNSHHVESLDIEVW